MSGGNRFYFGIVAFVISPSLFCADLAVPHLRESGREELSGEGGKRSKRDFRVIHPKQPKIDLSLGSSIFHDSNPRLTREGKGTGASTVDFGFHFTMGDEREKGAFYEFDYGLTSFKYTEASLRPPGDNSLDHRILARIGLNRARTKFRLSSAYRRNSGYAVDFEELNRETRAAQSDEFSLDFQVARESPHGSLEAKVGTNIEQFRASNLNDGSRTYADLAWYLRPGFAPKTDIGLGFRFGSDDYDGLEGQRFYTPSFRWRYRMSGKTTLFSSVGYEFRRTDAAASQTSEQLVYNGGLAWTPSPKTALEFSLGRSVSPSYLPGSGNYESTTGTIKIHKRIGKKLVLTGSTGIEDADYFDASTARLSGRDDTFYKSSVNLMHPFKLGPKLDGEVNVFCAYNRNISTIDEFEFEQRIAGVRFGILF